MTRHLPTTPAPATTPTVKPWRAVQLVATREVLVSLRSKATVVSFLIVLAGVVLGIVGMNVFGGQGGLGGPTKVAISTKVTVPFQGEDFEATEVATATEALALVRTGDVDAAVVDAADLSGTPVYGPDGTRLDLAGTQGPVVIGKSEASESVTEALSTSPPAGIIEPSNVPPWLGSILAIAFGFVFMMASILYGSVIAQSVVEEKATRIVEILLATITPRVLMFGKVLGNATLALGQIALIAVAAAVTMAFTGQALLLTMLGPALIWFVLLYAVGFTLFASFYAGAAALVSRQEDVGSVTSPLTMLIMIPYFLVILGSQNATLMTVMSYVPLSAPVGMPVRLMLGQAAWWEPVVAMILLAAATIVAIMIGARMYERSVLRTGARVKLSEAIRRR